MATKSHFGLWLVAVCALLGSFLSTSVAPKLIASYFNPPEQFAGSGIAPIEWELSRFQWTQVGGAVVGGVVGLAAFILWARRK